MDYYSIHSGYIKGLYTMYNGAGVESTEAEVLNKYRNLIPARNQVGINSSQE
jgi:hypothetical protein